MRLRLTIGQGVGTWRRREIAENAEEHHQENKSTSNLVVTVT